MRAPFPVDPAAHCWPWRPSTIFAPLSQATGSTPATTAKKKKKKSLKCKKGYVKKTVKDRQEEGQEEDRPGQEVRQEEGDDQEAGRRSRPTTRPAASQPPNPRYSGTDEPGPADHRHQAVERHRQRHWQAHDRLRDRPRTYDVSAFGVSPGSNFTVSDRNSKSPGNASLPVLVKGTIANGAITGTIQPMSNSRCPGGPTVTYQARFWRRLANGSSSLSRT